MNSVYIKDITAIFPDEIEEEINKDYISRNERRKLDRCSLISLAAAKKLNDRNGECLHDREDTAVIAATCFGATNTMEDETLKYYDSGMVSPIFVTKILANMQAAVISIALRLKGTSYSVSTGVNSSCDAIIDGCGLLNENREQAVLIASSDSCLNNYGKTILKNYENATDQDLVECGAAIFLESSKKSGNIAEITQTNKGIMNKGDKMPDFLIKMQNSGIMHGVYFESLDHVIQSPHNYLGAQSMFDINYGLDYCKHNNIDDFFVFSITQKKHYCVLHIRCIDN